MIYDALPALRRYAALHSLFGAAADWIETTDLSALPDGRVDLDGDDLYAVVMSVEGRGEADSPLETHRRYIDIQLCLEGTDRMGWAPVDSLEGRGRGYSDEKDLEFHEGAPVAWFDVPPGHFALFYPRDAHAPLAGAGAMRKVVIKVRA